jgi:hypothetical protein
MRGTRESAYPKSEGFPGVANAPLPDSRNRTHQKDSGQNDGGIRRIGSMLYEHKYLAEGIKGSQSLLFHLGS